MNAADDFERMGGVLTYGNRKGVLVRFYFNKDAMAYESNDQLYLIDCERDCDGPFPVQVINVNSISLQGSARPIEDAEKEEILRNIEAAAKAADLPLRFESV